MGPSIVSADNFFLSDQTKYWPVEISSSYWKESSHAAISIYLEFYWHLKHSFLNIRKCLFAHSVFANFGLNAHSVFSSFSLNANSLDYSIILWTKEKSYAFFLFSIARTGQVKLSQLQPGASALGADMAVQWPDRLSTVPLFPTWLGSGCLPQTLSILFYSSSCDSFSLTLCRFKKRKRIDTNTFPQN